MKKSKIKQMRRDRNKKGFRVRRNPRSYTKDNRNERSRSCTNCGNKLKNPVFSLCKNCHSAYQAGRKGINYVEQSYYDEHSCYFCYEDTEYPYICDNCLKMYNKGESDYRKERRSRR